MSAKNITNITIKSYDEALCDHFRSHIGKDAQDQPVMYVVYAPPNLAFRYAIKRELTDNSIEEVKNILTQTNNQLKLPLISVYRPNGFQISNLTHEVMGSNVPVFYATYIEEDSGKEVARNLQRLFVNIPYQIDLWTNDETQVVEIAQSLVFLLKKSPTIKVKKFLKGLNLHERFTDEYYDGTFEFRVSLDDNISDNSEIESEESSGKLYRYTFSLVIEDAILARDTRLNLADSIIVDIEYDEDDSNAITNIIGG